MSPTTSLRSRTRRALLVALGLVAGITAERPVPGRDERGLSQSTENAILLAGAVAVATVVVTAITIYVKSKLPG